MIVFHEGLPRSGKSYEAMVTRIIPALQRGRGVLAYIEGLNYDRIAEAAELPVETVRKLLRSLTAEQIEPVPDPKNAKLPDRQPLLDHVRDNELIIIDEAQDWWGTKAKLSPEFTKFVTQHGHRGLDIVLMGQHLSDVHVLWKRRVETKLVFIKLNGIGREGNYSVTTAKKVGDRFQKIGTKIGKYDPKYFGTYASHVSTDTNTENYKDKRATVWSSGLMKYGLPLGILLGVWGFYSVWKYFHPEAEQFKPKAVASKAKGEQVSQAKPAASAASAPTRLEKIEQKIKDMRSPQERLFAENSSKYRIRYAGGLSQGMRQGGLIEWLDGGAKVMERMSLDELREMGVSVIVNPSRTIVILTAGEWQAMATMWPISEEAKVPDNKIEDLRAQAAAINATVTGNKGPANLGGARPTPLESPKVEATPQGNEPLAPIIVRGPPKKP